jgi:hypothetical protein
MAMPSTLERRKYKQKAWDSAVSWLYFTIKAGLYFANPDIAQVLPTDTSI